MSERVMAGSSKTENSAEDKIMDLFKSHALLKQEFKSLEKDNFLLNKAKTDQTALIESLENKLTKLEKYLTKPANYQDLKVYYQLHLIWQTCNRYIHKFRDRLVDQQSDRERKQQLLEFNQEKSKHLKRINKRILSSKSELEAATIEAHKLNSAISSKKSIFHFFAKQKLIKKHLQAHAYESGAYADLQDLYDERIKIESEPWPEFEGVDLAGKRSINIAMVALAQYFFVSLSELGLSHKCFMASKKPVWELTYGDAAKQKLIIGLCEDKLKYFSELKDLSTEVQSRMVVLKESVVYKSGSDSIPVIDSITKVANDFSDLALDVTLTDVDYEVNVLKENFWGVTDLMIP